MARKRQPAKQPRRKPNTGAIRYKKGRPRPFEASFPTEGGKYRTDYFATHEEASAHLDQLTAERDSTVAPRNIARGSMRVDEYLDFWMGIRRPHLSPKSIDAYEYHCTLAIERIGSWRIDAVARPDADQLLAYYHGRGFKNVAQLRTVLRQAFEYAVEEDWIRKNPFQKAQAPPVERPKRNVLTAPQRDHMLACAAAYDDPDVPLCPIWHLYSRLGFRRGEGLGVRWADVDWGGSTISIAQQIANLGSAALTRKPKTPKSKRLIPVPADIMRMLADLRAWQRQRADVDSDWVDSGLVFVDQHGRGVKPSQVSYRWSLLRQHAGITIPLTIHDLRHTSLSIIEKAGTPLSVVQSIAGHSSQTTTRHYVDHADLDDMRAALE